LAVKITTSGAQTRGENHTPGAQSSCLRDKTSFLMKISSKLSNFICFLDQLKHEIIKWCPTSRTTQVLWILFFLIPVLMPLVIPFSVS
jgi:hypothetical protein